ncbi:MAG: response regulator transcription factor [Chloroflexaceae bacterium]
MRSSRHVLIADDDDGVRALLARIVVRIYPAISVSAVNDGTEALLLYGQHGADLLLTNFNMPIMDGLDLVRALRTRGETLPIIMISAEPGIEQQALSIGVTRFLLKPFGVSRITRTITDLLPL